MPLFHFLQHFSHLPASQIAEQLNLCISQHEAVVVTAPPGAGKSTLLPLTLLHSLPTDGGKILMLEPRRLAAKQIAMRMAILLGEKVGQTVGYRVRFESCTSAQTRIEVLTEGILTRMLIDDATLDGVGIVIFDEFHERSINTDLALALTRRSQEIIRPDLKIVLMSATIDASHICHTLHAPLIESEGRMYPVRTEYLTADPSPREMPEAVASAVRRALQETEGDVLAFLPGQSEIERCMKLLASVAETGIHVYPLYGNLSPERQNETIAPSAPEERKVVLATPIAETSLTIEGVRAVIDSGLCRKLVFDARTQLSALQTVRISLDMATQRMGRAGRVAEGVCYRLWSKASESRMLSQRLPEIEEADLAPLLLDVVAFGEQHVEELPWLTLPPRPERILATERLRNLGAITTENSITPIGKKMAQLPCHPRIARMMLSAPSKEMQALACDIAALIEEKDPLAETESGADLSLRITRLRQARSLHQIGRWSRIAQIAREYRRMIHTEQSNTDVSPEDCGLLIALAYPERVAKSTDGVGHFRLADGNNAQVDASDWLSSHEWLAVASLHAAQGSIGHIFLAAPLNPSSLPPSNIQKRNNLSWDNKRGMLLAQREKRTGQLLIEAHPLQQVSPEEVSQVICSATAKYGLSMFSWTDEVQALQRRVAQVAAWHPELSFTDISTDHLLATAADWLPFFLTQGTRSLTTTAELRRLPLAEILWSLIPYPEQEAINRLAPTHITVPTGSRIRLDYRQGASTPILSVRLQECFGLEDTPCVDDGKRPVLMELLSPGFKPVQLTQDLHSFWQNAYFEVRKELRRRYPKHYWPENPLEAEAVRGVKRKE